MEPVLQGAGGMLLPDPLFQAELVKVRWLVLSGGEVHPTGLVLSLHTGVTCTGVTIPTRDRVSCPAQRQPPDACHFVNITIVQLCS